MINQVMPIPNQITAQTSCPQCHGSLLPVDNFCSHCGYDLSKNRNVGIGKQIYIYLVSFLLPPFGLVWTWRYLRTSNSQLQRVGIVAALLTVVALVLTVWVTMGFLQGIQQQLNTYSNLGL